jgi:hypothetical protein
MSALSDYLENALLNHLLRNSAYSQPATLYFALFTADPGESGVSGEVSGGSYARAAVTNNNVNFPQCAASGTPTKTNGTTITFPTATAAWGSVTHWAIYDTNSGGTNMLMHGSLSSTRYVASGDTPKIAAGALSITVTNATSGGLTDFTKRKLLDHVFGGPTYTPAGTVYLGLGTSVSGESITEWDESSYNRQAAAFDAASGGACVNSDAETFTASVLDGEATLSAFGVWDDATAGNLLVVGPLSTSRTVQIGDTALIPDSGFTVTLQ